MLMPLLSFFITKNLATRKPQAWASNGAIHQPRHCLALGHAAAPITLVQKGGLEAVGKFAM